MAMAAIEDDDGGLDAFALEVLGIGQGNRQDLESDGEESISSERSEELFQYERLVHRLQTFHLELLNIDTFSLVDLILDNIDEFCSALDAYSGPLPLLAFGDDLPSSRTYTVSPSKKEAWQKFLQSIQKLTNVEDIDISPGLFNAEQTIELLESLPKAKLLTVKMHRRALSPDDMETFFRTIAACDQYEKLSVELYNYRDPIEVLVEQHLSSTPIAIESTVSQLLSYLGSKSLTELAIYHTTLSPEDCTALVQHLESSSCVVERLSMNRCEFPYGEGERVAKTFSQMTSVKSLSVGDSFLDEAFRNELLTSLASNVILKSLSLSADLAPFPGQAAFHTDLLKKVLKENRTLEHFSGSCQEVQEYFESAENLEELEDSVRQNYNLQYLSIWSAHPFKEILELNKAGRRYLSDDPSSTSKCMEVLSNVKNDLDCLYIHMRENPILCISAASNARVAGKKRDDSVDGGSIKMTR